MHCLQFSTEDDYTEQLSPSHPRFPNYKSTASNVNGPNGQPTSDLQLEIECIQLYFSNLHLIYSFLDQHRFWERCEKEIWEPRRNLTGQASRVRPSQFPSLYSAVLAIGALTAGDCAPIVQDVERVRTFLAAQIPCSVRRTKQKNFVRPSFELAHFFYACSKALLGNIIESSSVDISQTLLLMVSSGNLPWLGGLGCDGENSQSSTNTP